MPRKSEYRTINMYGTSIAAAVTPYVYLYKGKWVLDKAASATAGIAVWIDAPAAGGGGLGADHRLTIVAIPHGDNKIGYEVTIPDEVAVGKYDLVFLNGLIYKSGIRIEVKADKTVIDVTNRDGK